MMRFLKLYDNRIFKYRVVKDIVSTSINYRNIDN